MNTPLPPLGMVHSLTSTTYPTTISSSMHVLDMMPPTHQPLPREVVEFWGLPPLILFFNMSTGWFGRFVLSTIVNPNKEAWLQESKLAKMLCTGHREFGTKRCKFLLKVKHFIF